AKRGVDRPVVGGQEPCHGNVHGVGIAAGNRGEAVTDHQVAHRQGVVAECDDKTPAGVGTGGGPAIGCALDVGRGISAAPAGADQARHIGKGAVAVAVVGGATNVGYEIILCRVYRNVTAGSRGLEFNLVTGGAGILAPPV